MNEIRKLIEAIEKINEGSDWSLPDAEFDQFVRDLTAITSTREQFRTLYLWVKAENGLTEEDFIDLTEYL